MSHSRQFLVLHFILLTISGCINIAGDCKTTITKRLHNPSKTLQAVSDITDCGATTTPSSGLRIFENIDPNYEGTRENTILGSGKGFDFFWQSNDTLIVKGADTTGGYTMENVYPLTKNRGKVVIIYRD
jgi:hypothetical protein